MGMVIRRLWGPVLARLLAYLLLRLRLATDGRVRLGAGLELRLRLWCKRGGKCLCRGCGGTAGRRRSLESARGGVSEGRLWWGGWDRVGGARLWLICLVGEAD